MARNNPETRPYPEWICGDCGELYGRWRNGHVGTFHLGDTCGWCGVETVTTEPRDYRYPLHPDRIERIKRLGFDMAGEVIADKAARIAELEKAIADIAPWLERTLERKRPGVAPGQAEDYKIACKAVLRVAATLER